MPGKKTGAEVLKLWLLDGDKISVPWLSTAETPTGTSSSSSTVTSSSSGVVFKTGGATIVDIDSSLMVSSGLEEDELLTLGGLGGPGELLTLESPGRAID